MTYESEERLMVQGIEADAKKWPAHGEIPPTHEELVKMKQAQGNPPPEGSCGTCAYKLAVCRAAECMTTHHSLWKPVREEK